MSFRELAVRSASFLVRAIPPHVTWNFSKSIENPRLQNFLNRHFSTYELQMPDDIRRELSAARWDSEWFHDVWFSKPLHHDHLEARHRVLKMLATVCAEDPLIDSIDDLGDCNGTFLRDATLVVPQLKEYRGWEYSQRANSILADRFKDDPRLKFYETNSEKLNAFAPNGVLVTSGTLQYMSETELAEFLEMAAQAKRKHILLSEISQYGLHQTSPSTLRKYDTFNHDYKNLLENAGYEVKSAQTFAFKQDAKWVVIHGQLKTLAN